MEHILQEVQIANFFLVIFVGLILLLALTAAANLGMISNAEALLIGIIVLVSFVLYMTDFIRAKKFRHVLKHVK